MSSNGGASWPQALERLSSNQQRARESAVTSIKLYFGQKHADELKDSAYHTILEALFRVATGEKQAYLSAKTNNARTKAENNLSECAAAIRNVIAAGSCRFRVKTVRAIIEHVTQLLPTSNGNQYCGGLTRTYFRILVALLERDEHIEQLATQDWESSLEFCLRVIGVYCHHDPSQSSLSRTPGSSLVVKSSSRSIGSQKDGSNLTAQNVEEVMECLLYLLAASNSPIILSAESCSGVLLQFLQHASPMGTVHKMAFQALNHLLLRSYADRLSVANTIAAQVLPIVSRLWSSRNASKDNQMVNSVKEQILITLLILELHFQRMCVDGNQEIVDHSAELATIIRDEYAKRSVGEMLQITDLDLSMRDDEGEAATSHPLLIGEIPLRVTDAKTERNWAMVYVMGLLVRLSSGFRQAAVRPAHGSSDEDHQRKRRRLNNVSWDLLLSELQGSDIAHHLTALQILSVTLPSYSGPIEPAMQVFDAVTSSMTSVHEEVACWAMIVLAMAARNDLMRAHGRVAWIQVCRSALKPVTASRTCSAASFLIHTLLSQGVVKFYELSDELDALLTSAESAPATLCDASLALVSHLLHLRNSDSPSGGETISRQVVRWLATKWSPDAMIDVGKGSFPLSFLNVLRVSINLPVLRLSEIGNEVVGNIGQSWTLHNQHRPLLEYLLLLDSTAMVQVSCSTCPSGSFLHQRHQTQAEPRSRLALREIIASLIIPGMSVYAAKEHAESGDMISGEAHGAVQPLRIENLQAKIVKFVFGQLLQSTILSSTSSQVAELQHGLQELEEQIKAAVGLLSQNVSAADVRSGIIDTIRPFIPSCSSLEFGHCLKHDKTLMQFLIEVMDVSTTTAERFSSVAVDMDNRAGFLDDLMEGGKSPSKDATNLRSNVGMNCSLFGLRAMTTSRIVLLASVAQSNDFDETMSSAAIDHFVHLDDDHLLAQNRLIRSLIIQKMISSHQDIVALIKRVGRLIENPAHLNNEVALTLCLNLLAYCAESWAVQDAGELTECALDLYHFFVTSYMPKHRMSRDTEVNLAGLFLRLMQVHVNYDLPDVPSARTSLLALQARACLSSRFQISEEIPALFRLYVLSLHERFLEDVVKSLPEDFEWLEGILFRLHILGRLAASWPTLLRSCVYYILEVPGHLPIASSHAKHCLANVADVLQLDGPRELFRLFASQLLYTWLAAEEVERLPYSIFGYDTLRDLLDDCCSELVGLLVMRDQDEQLQTVAKIVQSPLQSLMAQSFTKAIAYSVAHDISVPPPSSFIGSYITGEKRVHKLLGKDVFFDLLSQHFADIIAVFFKSTDQVEHLSRALIKRSGFDFAVSNLNHMQAGQSILALPPSQQPAFKAKYLVDQIAHLCSRTQYDAKDLYTPTMFVKVARTILSMIHPALGSLHACAMLRKLRVLMALSDKVCFRGYCLQMLLLAVRPFATDAECAVDAIGILRYLFEGGYESLINNVPFLLGISLTVLASLQEVLQSSLDKTDVDTQHQSNLSATQAFYDWFGSYLQKCAADIACEKTKIVFEGTLTSAIHAKAHGTARKGTVEGQLLLHILNDETSGRNLISTPFKALALTRVFKNFAVPASSHEDMLSEDVLASKYAVSIWGLCKATRPPSKVLVWAAKVLGRSFAASGQVEEQLLRETDLARLQSVPIPTDRKMISQSTLLALIENLCFTVGDGPIAGYAEAVLRVVAFDLTEAEMELFAEFFRSSILKAVSWEPAYRPPPSDVQIVSIPIPHELDLAEGAILKPSWLAHTVAYLAASVTGDKLLSRLPVLLYNSSEFARDAFPFVLHLALASEMDATKALKKQVSKAFRSWIKTVDTEATYSLKRIINALIYLRTQKLPKEHSPADRTSWLDVDYSDISAAAVRCKMFKTALLFLEVAVSDTGRASSRRSSNSAQAEPTKALRAIFDNIDDPDLFYGLQQEASLGRVLDRLEYEKNGTKSLAFRSAAYDAQLRLRGGLSSSDPQPLISALNMLSYNGLSHSLVQTGRESSVFSMSASTMFGTAQKLEQWDIPVPASTHDDSATMYRLLQSINAANNRQSIVKAVDVAIESSFVQLLQPNSDLKTIRHGLQSLAAITEIDEILSNNSSEQFEGLTSKFVSRASWMRLGKLEDLRQILSCRETALSVLSRQRQLQGVMHIGISDARLVEVRTNLLSSKIYRALGAHQESLNIATYLDSLTETCREAGLNVDAAIRLETAHVLQEQNEITIPVAMLRAIESQRHDSTQSIHVDRSVLLAELGSQVAAARLEKPGAIIDRYLEPALKELKGNHEGEDAAHVFHEFASFCDQQLQDVDNTEDLARLRRLKDMKESEMLDLARMVKSATSSSSKSRYQSHYNKAKSWFRLDNDEYIRHLDSRRRLLRQCLENYMLCLAASDDYNNDALRFCVLWLEHSDDATANEAVAKHVAKVPSRKFAALMNQLTSRLLDQKSTFQESLFSVVLRICAEHPFHGMYQIWAATHAKVGNKDENGMARYSATLRLSKQLSKTVHSSLWSSINTVNSSYCLLAAEQDQTYRQSAKIPVSRSAAATNLGNAFKRNRVPPPTMHIEISPSLDYSWVPTMHRLDPKMTIASGVSAPKVITIKGSDGIDYKQLVKGGNDDLRQDAIMEQVFTQVSELLKNKPATRQRKLGIRTYKVQPLTPNAGVIEFVPNSLPLHEYLMPAHELYHPQDLKSNACRKIMSDAQNSRLEEKMIAYRHVTDRFHPVLRYFFVERFHDPEEWFDRRTAYTRSTAVASILGYIVGLGDRHGHNILLDQRTGEVVHIDLGVAFEAGRVLPVPELIPFRLTRDIVDGMGITKTEGIFRRCCEFTLDALRTESSSIMAILDVLRHDPLHSWTISPIRLAKLQNAQSAAPLTETNADGVSKPIVNEPSEADRALTVVKKKLSKALSVTATVNDLINQATDEKNLASLYSGWAAYA